jgi:peptidoglycan/xylan/chitin deacetylase (PgdA/CDA1 family)
VSNTTRAGFAPRQLGHPGNVPRALSLTFDDGPDPTWTPQILQQLQRCQAAATFFMVGEQVLAQPGLAHNVLAAGHEIQLHCHRHIRHTELTEAELQHDSELALAALESVGVRPRLWRAPWGVCTDATHRVAERLGLQLVRWLIDTHDWRGDEPQAMLDHACSQLADGGAVLMHDALGPGARRAGCQNTLALLPALAATARAHGFLLAPMGHRTHCPPSRGWTQDHQARR